MAIRNEEVVRGLTVPIPDTLVVVKITGMERQVSQKGNPMIVTDVEIAAPGKIEVGGAKIQIGGESGKMFGMLDTSNPMGFAKFHAGLCRGGLDPAEVQSEFLQEGEIFCDDKPAALKPFVGKYMQMTISAEKMVAMRNPTPDERKAGVKAEPLKDKDGNEIAKGYRLKLDWQNVVGASEKPNENGPF